MEDTDEKELTKLYYSIAEVAGMINESKSLLRHWEAVFPMIKPKRIGGSRSYMKEDIKMIKLIHYLVKQKGMTLEGARNTIEQNKSGELSKLDVISRLERVKIELKNMMEELNKRPQ